MFKKNLVIIFIIFVAMLFINACSSKGPFIGVTIYNGNDIFANYIKINLEKLFSGRAKFIINDSKNNQANQNEQIDNYISSGVSVLAVNLVDTQAAGRIVNKAMEGNIPVIFFNKFPSKAVMDSYNKVWYVGTLSEEAAYMQGKIIVDSWSDNPNWDKNGDGKIQCIILQGEPGHYDTEIRTKNVISFIENNGIEVEVLEQKTAMWSKDKAKIIVDGWMQDNISEDSDTNVEYIFSNNDSMALGALRSIQSFGYNNGDSNKYIPIVGIDAIDEVLEEISKGNIVGTVLNDSFSQAKAVSDLALNLFKGYENPIIGTSWIMHDKSVRIHYKPITIDNLSEIRK